VKHPKSRLIAGVSVPDTALIVEAIAPAEMSEILNAFPRLKFKEGFTKACCHLVETKPETASDNFLRDFGERFVPGYKPVSAVDLLMRAPFDE
jgi:hypothetical protein